MDIPEVDNPILDVGDYFMGKVGYIIKHNVTVNGKEYEYFYLRRSDRVKGVVKDGKYPKTQVNLFKFGNRKKALALLSVWENNINDMPESLKTMGYSINDVKKWKNQIECK